MHLSYQAIKKTVLINETTGILNCTFDIYGVEQIPTIYLVLIFLLL